MDMKTYIEGVLNLEIVERLYILKKSDSLTYLVTATGLDSSKDLIDGNGVLDKEFTYPYDSDFETALSSLKENGFNVFSRIYKEDYPGCPYQKKAWIVEKK